MGDVNAAVLIVMGVVAVFALVGAIKTYGIGGFRLAVAFIVAGGVVALAAWVGVLDKITEALQ